MHKALITMELSKLYVSTVEKLYETITFRDYPYLHEAITTVELSKLHEALTIEEISKLQ